MTARSRISSRERLQRQLALAGNDWHHLAILAIRSFLARCVPRARKCQEMPGVVRPTGFEPVACGSGGKRT